MEWMCLGQHVAMLQMDRVLGHFHFLLTTVPSHFMLELAR